MPFRVASMKESKPTFANSGFSTIVLEESHMVSHNVKYLKFKLPKGDEQSGLKTITSLLTRHTPKGGFIPVFRPYTPIDADEAGHVSFLVKKYPNGRGSGHMFSLKPGDELKVKPLHEYDYKSNTHSQLTILAGGAGITPFIQLIRSVLSNPEDKTKITLVYANSTDEDILQKSEFDEHAQRHPERFQAKYLVSNKKKSEAGGEPVEEGRITKAIIEQALSAEDRRRSSMVLVCGPPPMMDAVAGKKGMFGFSQGSLGGMLKEIGLRSDQVHKF